MSTEWEDLLVKHGILKEPQNEDIKTKEIVYSISNRKTKSDNEPNHDDVDELLDSDNDEVFARFKRERYEQLRLRGNRTFTGLLNIQRSDFVTQVSEASESVPVIVHLHQPSHPASALLSQHLARLATEYDDGVVKFVQILSTDCIDRYPDANLPTILVYRNRSVTDQLVQTTPEKVRMLVKRLAQEMNEQ